MVPAASDKISRVPPYSGSLFEKTLFHLQGFHLLRRTFPHTSIIKSFSYSTYEVLQPQIALVWALSFSLATTREIDFSFFSSSYLDVSVHWVALSDTMCSCQDSSTFLLVGSPIRRPPDQCVLTAPRGISLFVASFFSS